MGRHFRHVHDHDEHKGKIIGVGLFALLIGAVAGALLSPKSGSENRENLADWMDDFRRDVNRKVHDTKEMTEEKYDDIVEMVSDKYRKLKNIKDNEFDDFVEDLKERWDRIRDEWHE